MASFPLQDKIIAITGGSSGIGLATSKLLSSRGATVCICDFNETTLASTKEHFSSLEAPFTCNRVDVSKVEEVDSWIEGIVKQYGRLDGAVNCAGVMGKGLGTVGLVDMKDEDWDSIMGVNLKGLMYCLRAELRVLVDKGSIVNVTSILGVVGAANCTAYSASKHGVIGLTRSAAKEVGNREIRVNCVAPGSTLTPMLQNAQEAGGRVGAEYPSAIKRYGTADELASIIAFLIGPESTFVTGAVYMGDGGWNC